MLIVSILFLISFTFALGACICAYKILINCKQLQSALKTENFEHQTLKMKYDTAIADYKVIQKENAQLKAELSAERKITAAYNCKAVDELPKTEKVAKPRGRKKTTK